MIRAALAILVVTVLGVLLLQPASHAPGTPVSPGARYTDQDRERAIRRGMNFIYDQIARQPQPFADWGHDLLSAFYNIAETSSDPNLRSMAWRMGHERALEWRRLHPAVAKDDGPDDILVLVFGHDAATRLGVPDPHLHQQLLAAVSRYRPYDFLWFDPTKEPPPSDVPKPCKCGYVNERGVKNCVRCGQPLRMENRYNIFQDALISTYTGDRAGIPLGGHYKDVLQWLPQFRPYPPPGRDNYAGIYTITHVIYTYNDYSQYRVSPACFPEEFEHLKHYEQEAVKDHDSETMGEFLDTLRAFGLTTGDPLIRAGFEYLLSAQNPDGSWGRMDSSNTYGRYHPTWTAIDGLRDYRWNKVLGCPVF